MQRHTWREHTEEGLRYYRATYHASKWTLASQLRGESEWQRHDPINEDEWRKLREVLWRKYQRRRCPWELVERIDRYLEELAEQGGQGASAPDEYRFDKGKK